MLWMLWKTRWPTAKRKKNTFLIHVNLWIKWKTFFSLDNMHFKLTSCLFFCLHTNLIATMNYIFKKLTLQNWVLHAHLWPPCWMDYVKSFHIFSVSGKRNLKKKFNFFVSISTGSKKKSKSLNFRRKFKFSFNCHQLEESIYIF